jgi:hypothetical protein
MHPRKRFTESFLETFLKPQVKSGRTGFHPTPTDRRAAVALGLLLLAVYLATGGLHFQSIDEVAVFTVARSLAGRGAFDADPIFWTRVQSGAGSVIARGVDGHFYAVKDLAPSLLAAPLVALANAVGVSPIRAALLLSPLATALTGALLYLTARRWGHGRPASALAALTFGLGSMAWPYAETLFTQPLTALGLLIALMGVSRAREADDWRAALIGGLGLGLAGLSAAPVWISLLVYPFFLVDWHAPFKRWRRLVAVGGGAGVCGLAQAGYNLARFGAPWETGHAQLGATQRLALTHLDVGLVGQLFSAPTGLIWFAPFVLLVPAGIVLGWRQGRDKLLLVGGQAAAVLLMYSLYGEWWAGLSWGPRFLVALMPALTLLAAPALDWLLGAGRWPLRALAWLVLGLSFLTEALAALFDYVQSEVPIFQWYAETAYSPRLADYFPFFVQPRWLPLPRQVMAAGRGAWDVLWMSGRGFDGPLLAAHLALIAAALLWAIQAARGRDVRRGLAAQGALTMGLIALMLGRYPQGAANYQTDQKPPPEGMAEAIAAVEEQARPGDGVLALLTYSPLAWLDGYPGRLPDTGLMLEEPPSRYTVETLRRVSEWYPRVWLVSEATTGGDPANGAERWLSERGYVGGETWYGRIRVVSYTFAENVGLAAADQAWGEGAIRLAGYGVERSAVGWLNVRLRWEAAGEVGADYAVFVHLLDENGALIAQHDGLPLNGYAPTRTWGTGDVIDDRHSVPLPPDLPAGSYRLTAGLYDPLTGERLPLAGGDGDALTLETIQID